MTDFFIDPTKEQFAELMGLGRDYPVEMINLIKFNAKAVYDDGRVATGVEAYQTYSQKTAPFLEKVGGKVIWSGAPEFMMIGPQNEAWDLVFIVHYPTGQAFLDMVTNPDYQAITFHRNAAVETSRLIRTRPN